MKVTFSNGYELNATIAVENYDINNEKNALTIRINGRINIEAVYSSIKDAIGKITVTDDVGTVTFSDYEEIMFIQNAMNDEAMEASIGLAKAKKEKKEDQR